MSAVKEQAQSAAIQSSEQTLEFLKSYSVSSFKEETGFSPNLRLYFHHDGEIARRFNEIRVTPTTVLIDADGGIVWQRIGLLDFHRVEREIRRLLPSEQSA